MTTGRGSGRHFGGDRAVLYINGWGMLGNEVGVARWVDDDDFRDFRCLMGR